MESTRDKKEKREKRKEESPERKSPEEKKQPEKKTNLIDDKQLIFETSEGIDIFTSFDAMKIREELLRGNHIQILPSFS